MPRRFADRITTVILATSATALSALLLVALQRAHGPVSWRAGIAALALAGGATATLAALATHGAFRRAVAVGCVTIGVGLYAAEAVLELSPPPRPALRAAERLGHAVDRRSRREVLDSLRGTGLDAFPGMVPAVAWGLRADPDAPATPWPDSLPPLGGVPQVVTVFCNESGRYTVFRSDANGFNNAGAPDRAGTGGIAVIGDSFVEGACVPADSGLVPMLRSHWSDARGFGLAGDGPLLELATMREIVAPLRPRLVLWCYYEGNDLLDLQVEQRQERLTRYLRPGYSLGLGRGAGTVLRDWLSALYERGAPPARHLRLRDMATLYVLRARLGVGDLSPPSAARSHDVDMFREVLRRARADVEGWGGRLVMIYLPAWDRYYAPRGVPSHRDEVLASARALQVPVVDLDAVFGPAAGRAVLFGLGDRYTGHYSVAGYEAAARAVIRALEQDGTYRRSAP